MITINCRNIINFHLIYFTDYIVFFVSKYVYEVNNTENIYKFHSIKEVEWLKGYKLNKFY